LLSAPRRTHDANELCFLAGKVREAIEKMAAEAAGGTPAFGRGGKVG